MESLSITFLIWADFIIIMIVWMTMTHIGMASYLTTGPCPSVVLWRIWIDLYPHHLPVTHATCKPGFMLLFLYFLNSLLWFSVASLLTVWFSLSGVFTEDTPLFHTFPSSFLGILINKVSYNRSYNEYQTYYCGNNHATIVCSYYHL